MKGKMLKKFVCVAGLLFMSFPAWSAVPSNLFPTDSVSSQMSLTADLASPLFEEDIFLARGPGAGAGVGAGAGAGIGAGAGAAGDASAQGCATSAAATSSDTTGLEKGTAVVGTTPAAESAATSLNTAAENSTANDDEESSPYGEY